MQRIRSNDRSSHLAPQTPSVELAHVTLSAAGMVIQNAGDPLHPAVDSLYLRKRSHAGPFEVQKVNVLVTSLEMDVADLLQGWDQLGKFSQMVSKYLIIIDGEAQLPQDLSIYDLVYSGGKGDYSLRASQTKSLANFLEHCKTLKVESLSVPAQEACQKMLKKLDLKPLKPDDTSPLFSTPLLFAEAPAGFSGNPIEVGKNILYSTAVYARYWAGKGASGVASRSDIRSSHEWGLNLLCLGLKQAGG